MAWCLSRFFFFQAEDGIRALYVTRVQTCALPICAGPLARCDVVVGPGNAYVAAAKKLIFGDVGVDAVRSEERRVGKECRSRSRPSRSRESLSTALLRLYAARCLSAGLQGHGVQQG